MPRVTSRSALTICALCSLLIQTVAVSQAVSADSPDDMKQRVLELTNKHMQACLRIDGLRISELPKRGRGVQAEAFHEFGPQSMAVPFDPGEFEEISARLARLLQEQSPQWDPVWRLTFCLCRRPLSEDMTRLLLDVLEKPIPSARSACDGGQLTAIRHALAGLVTQWMPATRQTLLQIGLLPFKDAEHLFPPLDGKSMDSELKQWLANTSCHEVVNLAKRDDVLPFMKEVAAEYGIECGVAMPEEGDEHLRSIERLLWEAEQIAAGEDPWKGGAAEPEVPN